MAPDVTYVLTEDRYARYESLLAEQGVTVLPKSRETLEVLETPSESMFSVHGLVSHEGREFRFTIQRDQFGHHFYLYPFEDGVAGGKAVMDAVERAFPQPKRGVLQQPRPKRKWDTSRIFNTAGCLGIILFIAAVCFFAAVGIRHLFR